MEITPVLLVAPEERDLREVRPHQVALTWGLRAKHLSVETVDVDLMPQTMVATMDKDSLEVEVQVARVVVMLLHLQQ